MSQPRPLPVSASSGFPRRQPRYGLSWRPFAVAAVLIVLATAAVVTIDTSGSAPGGAPMQSRAVADARSFLSRYVDPDGRVVRRDQGGDTVSEGQAYGLLLAQVAGEPQRFARIWRWTDAHLRRPGGELATQTSASGQVQNSTPASDADVLTAWALSRTTGPGSARYHAQARTLAAAILGNETIADGSRLLLAAGPWATGQPGSLDPSYWSPQAFSALARFTGDRRWQQLATGATAVTQQLTGMGTSLPPDWAKLQNGTASPEPAPDGQAPQVRYGLDAQRAVVWDAASCNSADRALAASWWRLLQQPGRARALALSPQGATIDGQTNALPPVAAAAAADAAGDRPQANALLDQARHTQEDHPTYYGGAWLALGEALLGGRLGGCANATSGGGR